MIRMTIYRGARSNVPAAADDLTWPEFCAELEGMVNELPTAPPTASRDEQKKAMLAWSPHRLRDGTTRALANVEAVTALAIDVDGCDGDAVCGRLNGTAALVYGSPSDDATQPDARRLRIVAPVSREITPDECERTRFAFAERLGLAPGCGVEGAKDASRLFFAGRLHGTPERDVARFEGEPVDVDSLLGAALEHDWSSAKPSVPRSAEHTATLATTDRVSRVVGIMYPHYAAGGRHELCRALGGWLARFELGAWSDAEIAAVVGALPSDKTPARVQTALDAAAQARTGAVTIGWEALSARIGDDAARLEIAARSAWYANALADTGADPFHTVETAPEPLLLDLDKQGRPLRTTLNVYRVVEHKLGDKAWFDVMRGRPLCLGIDDSLGHMPDGLWTDCHTIALKMLCETMSMQPSTSSVEEAIKSYMREHTRNPWRDALISYAAQWDGVPRLDAAMVTYWGAADTPATRAASRVFLTSLAARGLEPGVKVDTCLILIGRQGAYKSTSLETLAGGPDQFSDSPLPIGDKDALQMIRGKVIWEIAELASMMRRDENAVKAFLSARVDTFRASYGHHTEDVPRTCIFAASSNVPEVLRDPTGSRRYMPVVVGRVDLAALRRDREQLLGEAAWRVGSGEAWWPTDAEAAALADVADNHHEVDPWDGPIRTWLHARRGVRTSVLAFAPEADAEAWLAEGDPPEPFTLEDVFDVDRGAVPLEIARRGKREEVRAAAVLTRLGYERSRLWSGPRRGAYVWSARAGGKVE